MYGRTEDERTKEKKQQSQNDVSLSHKAHVIFQSFINSSTLFRAQKKKKKTGFMNFYSLTFLQEDIGPIRIPLNVDQKNVHWR